MRILYLSCHAILEYDELRIFEELKIDYFSIGSYVIPTNPADKIRPALTYRPPANMYDHNIPPAEKLPRAFVDQFDTIIVMHVPEFIINNWDVIKDKRVIWRTIGQSTAKHERRLAKYRNEGLEVVRYSPREINIPDNIGTDAIIRFYKDPNEFNGWNGGGTEVMTLAQNLQHRGEFLNHKALTKVMHGFNSSVYGKSNEDLGAMNGGYLTYDQMKQKMRDARVYVYSGTQPASYTLSFIEAMMTGTPMVCLGSGYCNSLNIAGDLYEIPDIIENGYNGYVSDDIQYLRQMIKLLTENKHHANDISRMGRKKAIELFDRVKITEQWRHYLYGRHA